MAKQKRRSLSKKLRFEVFKRDSFKCQYCGASAPDVLLHVDHIEPVSKGGTNGILNLITSCAGCNLGKSDRLLEDDSIVVKQRRQLEELSEKHEQLKLILKWRKGLSSIDDASAAAIGEALIEACSMKLRPAGLKEAKQLAKKYGLVAVLDAIDKAESKFDRESVWKKVSGILWLQSQPEEEKRLRYLRGILRNKMGLSGQDMGKSLALLKEARSVGVTMECLGRIVAEARYWSHFSSSLSDAMDIATEDK